MNEFATLTSVAAPLPETDIDTDIIFPARFLLMMNKAGLGKHLFHERRNSHVPNQAPFVLNRPPFDQAKILVTGRNFGSGSSREHAVWALVDFGIRCIIAPRFGEIFYTNCFKNGLLPIVLTESLTDEVMTAAETGAILTIDLQAQSIQLPENRSIGFDVDPFYRRMLLLGLDEISTIIEDDGDSIRLFEKRQRTVAPWLHLKPEQLAYFDDLKSEISKERALNGE